MDNRDFDSKKFFILLCLVCGVFFFIIMNAFNYLPVEDENAKRITHETINRQPDLAEEDVSSEDEIAKSVKKEFNVELPKTDYERMLDEISEPPALNSQLSSDEIIALEPIDIPEENSADVSNNRVEKDIFSEAKKYAENKQYADALEEYQKISKMTDDIKIITQSYDEIARIYAINKRYGTALAFAIKSYNMEPTTNREMTLARLYYRSGDIDKATKRINNVLQRDFIDDK